ncbi:hypothetical protein ACFPN2_23110 [Steroidobacter flavus]|uniref:DUF4286 family protein n=1 Tax=Steroidobacter flavus TaxID=1842136 RepID=A0ABV8SXW0_9GAMM
MSEQKYFYIVLSNAAEGCDDEFNDWYTNQHVVDVLKVDGVIAAQRFRLAPEQRRDPPFPYRYLTIYEVMAGAARHVMDTLRRDSGSMVMPVSDTFQRDHVALVFDPITPRRLASDVRGAA